MQRGSDNIYHNGLLAIMIELKNIWILILIANFLFSIVAFVIIKFNDLKHLKKKVDEMKDEIDEIRDKTNSNSEAIAKIKGYLEGSK